MYLGYKFGISIVDKTWRNRRRHPYNGVSSLSSSSSTDFTIATADVDATRATDVAEFWPKLTGHEFPFAEEPFSKSTDLIDITLHPYVRNFQ